MELDMSQSGDLGALITQLNKQFLELTTDMAKLSRTLVKLSDHHPTVEKKEDVIQLDMFRSDGYGDETPRLWFWNHRT